MTSGVVYQSIYLINYAAQRVNMMSSPESIYAKAPIIWDGPARGVVDDNPISTFRMQIDNKWVWFIFEDIYEENGNDFDAHISYFGLKSKDSAGCTGDIFRVKFDKSVIDDIQRRIETFFKEPEEKPFPPFMIPQARCISVSFSPNWILTR